MSCLAPLVLLACGESSTSPPPGASLSLTLRSAGVDDPRTYSVGRVQLRALDENEELIAAEIFAIDRATGLFSLDFLVPAGPDRTLLIEPLGSAVLPDGERTNSGVALQAVVESLDVVADDVVSIEALLHPFIPDSVGIGFTGQAPDLVWKPMAIADAHRVRVIEVDVEGDSLVSRLVEVPASSARDRVPIDVLRAGRPFVGFQVQSINEFAESAFSDTLFFSGR